MLGLKVFTYKSKWSGKRLILLFFFNVDVVFILCVWVYVCMSHVDWVLWRLEEDQGPWNWSWVVLCHRVGETHSRSSAKASRAHNCSAVCPSPVPFISFSCSIPLATTSTNILNSKCKGVLSCPNCSRGAFSLVLAIMERYLFISSPLKSFGQPSIFLNFLKVLYIYTETVTITLR